MFNPKPLTKTLLAATFVALFSMGATTSFAEKNDQQRKVYTDPVTGEVKQAPKLLSQMTNEEKAQLSDQEYKALKDLEAEINKQEKLKKQKPGS